MRKKLLSLLLLGAVLFSLPSCISLRREDEGEEPPTETGTEISPEEFPDHTSVVDCSKREYGYDEMAADLRELAERYPDRFSIRTFGKTAAGRDLYAATLGNPDAAQTVLVSAAIHGREYLTALYTMTEIEYCLSGYDSLRFGGKTYRELFDRCKFVIVPMTNPDGVMLSETGISSISDEALRNKVNAIYLSDFREGLTSQQTVNGYLLYWKANANGVDLNRNFDAKWKEYRNFSLPSFAQYKGPAAASEPETQAMVALTKEAGEPEAVLCIHSQGEVIYWDCGQEAELRARTLAFSQAVAERNGYTLQTEQHNDASYSDWCALEQGLIAVTIETGAGICPLDLDKFPKIWKDNYDLFALTANYFRK